MTKEVFFEEFRSAEPQYNNKFPESKLLAFNQLYIRYILDLASRKLIPFNEADCAIGVKNKLVFRSLFEFLPNDYSMTSRSTKITKVIFRIIFIVFFFYCSYNIFSMALFRYRHDLALNDWQLKVKNDSFHTKNAL